VGTCGLTGGRERGERERERQRETEKRVGGNEEVVAITLEKKHDKAINLVFRCN